MPISKKSPSRLEFTIRPATEKDRTVVTDLYYDLLLSTDDRKKAPLEFLPVYQNAVIMWEHVFTPAIKRGDPVLLAFAGENPAGALFWTEVVTELHLREPMAQGHGTFVVARYRNKGIGTALRKEGVRILKKKGVSIVRGMVMDGNNTRFPSEFKNIVERVAVVYNIRLSDYVDPEDPIPGLGPSGSTNNPHAPQ